jgi:MFS transporter, DHA1 family, tetracycline resistance protein
VLDDEGRRLILHIGNEGVSTHTVNDERCSSRSNTMNKKPRKQSSLLARLVAIALVLMSVLPSASALQRTRKAVSASLQPSRPRLTVGNNPSGAPEKAAVVMINAAPAGRPLKVLQASSFLLVVSASLVAFSPATALTELLGADRATATLSGISASAALLEIALSPALGSILDSFGRKPVLLIVPLAFSLANAIVSVTPSVVPICAAKFVGMYSIGAFVIACQATTGDFTVDDPGQLSAALGVQRALVSAGFLVGALMAGSLSGFHLSVPYLASAITGTLAAIILHFGLPESLPLAKRVPFKAARMWSLVAQSPWSCTRLLLHHGTQVRTLGFILMLQSLPQFMGDVFQIYATKEWHLTTKGFSSLMAMFGVLGIAANMMGSILVRRLGIKRFTSISAFSYLLSSLGAVFFGLEGFVVGSGIGFLGVAQQMGVSAALMSQGARSGLPQGELAGARASMIALLKVIGPIWYSVLYVQGRATLGLHFLPFLFNVALGVGSFLLCQLYLPS